MKRALPLLALLAACGTEPATAPQKVEEPGRAAPSQAEAPPPATDPAPDEAPHDADEAARVLRLYYELIENRDYERAARLRSRGAEDAERLADNFKAYEAYNVQVGAPSRPARSGDWLYVSVPVMITGRFKGGKTFGSAGRVTLRRSASSDGAAAGGGWQVYTG